MAVRSINLKMILGRGEPSRRLRKSVWLTHSVVNEAVTEIERVLLLCRGRGYAYGDGELLCAEAVQQQALAFARQVQTANGKPNAGSDGDVLASLGQLYEALVPSVLLDERGNPLKGNAKAAGGFARPLMLARSEGKLTIFDEIVEPPPHWIALWKAGRPDAEEMSRAWLNSPEGQRLSRPGHRPAAWGNLLHQGKAWQEAFIDDQHTKREEASRPQGVPLLILRLKKELGLLPLFRPPITSRLAKKCAVLTSTVTV